MKQNNKRKSNKEVYFDRDYFEGGNRSNYISYRDHPFNKAIVNLIVKDIKKGKLLEIGCAYGYLLKHASDYFETYGMDISSYAIKQAERISPDSYLKIGDIETDLKQFIRKKKFQVIIALDILEHLEYPSKILNLIYKSLDSGGIFIFRVPNMSCINLKFRTIFGIEKGWDGYKDETHISLYTPKEWEKLIKDNGFECKIVSYFPVRSLKEIIAKRFPKFFFLPKFFLFTNDAITFYCTKK